MKITSKRNIELAFAVDAIQAIETRAIQKHQILSAINVIKYRFIKDFSHMKEICLLCLFI